MAASWITGSGGINSKILQPEMQEAANPGDILTVVAVMAIFAISNEEASRALQTIDALSMGICITQNAQGKQTVYRIY